MKNHHEELRWQKDEEIELKDEKNKIKACNDLDGGSDEMVEGIWTPEEKDESLGIKNLLIMNKLRRKGLLTWMK